MKSLFLSALMFLAGCNSSHSDQPHGGFGWSPPPPKEDRQRVYGDDAPDYPTMSEVLERNGDLPAK